MDSKNLRIDSALNERSNVNSSYAHGAPTFQCADKTKTYHDIGSNSSSKLDVSNGRPCAVIGPDRVVPPQLVSGDPYVKKGHTEPWQFTRPPEYPHRIADYPLYARNISPRQTFQENMQRIMMPPRCDPNKSIEDQAYSTDKSVSPSNSLQKPSRTPDMKYCEVPYTVNPVSNDSKSIKVSPTGVNSSYERSSAHVWHQGNMNIQHAPPYGVSDLHQYPEFANGPFPRQVHMNHPHRTSSNEPIRVYADPYYRTGTTRYEPYPAVKERYPNSRYDPIANYPRTYYPPFPQQKYDIQKIPVSNIPPAQYTGYPQTPIKFPESKLREPIRDNYPRPPPNYNLAYHNQSLYHGYSPLPGNCLQNKLYPFSTDPATTIRPQYGHMKQYTLPENIYINDISRNHQMKGPLAIPNYPINMQPHVPPYHYARKDNLGLTGRTYDYNMPLKNVDPSLNNFMAKIPSQFSPNVISPVESNTGSDVSHTYALSQEDYGYVSQSSNASVRSIDSSGINMHRIYDPRYGYVNHYSPRIEMDSKSKSKKELDVRQFLQMWNEGEEENNDTMKSPAPKKSDEKRDKQELYVLGLVNVPREELSKYEHIQKVSKLPENIKGYTSLDLLNQFEEAIESSNLENYSRPIQKESLQKQSQNSVQDNSITRPVSPLDVESKISQSVIHKEVGCNFEIKPCSPKMLNVEIPASAQKLLEERIIEKVTNPLINTPVMSNIDNFNVIQQQQNNRKSLRNEFKNTMSCKLAKTQCSVESSPDLSKSAYSIQDLESISGVCLASLPRLDNDIELNFPEVNQQFIDANKSDSLTSATQNISDTINHNNEVEPKLYADMLINSPSPLSENEYSKLSRFRKLKLNKDGHDQPLSSQQLRTDSVIIKNPESSENDTPNKNMQMHEDNIKFDKNFNHCSPIDLRNNKDELKKIEDFESDQNQTSSDDISDTLNLIVPLDTSLRDSTVQIVNPENVTSSVKPSSGHGSKCSSVLENISEALETKLTVNKPLINKSEGENIDVDFKQPENQQNTDIMLQNLDDSQIDSPNVINEGESDVINISNDIFDGKPEFISNNNDTTEVYKENENVATNNGDAKDSTMDVCNDMVKGSPIDVSDNLLKRTQKSPCADPVVLLKCSKSEELISDVDHDAVKTGQEVDTARDTFELPLGHTLKGEETDIYNYTCVAKTEDCSLTSVYESNSKTLLQNCDTKIGDKIFVDQDHIQPSQSESSENSDGIIAHDDTCEQLDVSNLIADSVIVSSRECLCAADETVENKVIKSLCDSEKQAICFTENAIDISSSGNSRPTDAIENAVKHNRDEIYVYEAFPYPTINPNPIFSCEDRPKSNTKSLYTKENKTRFCKKEWSWLIDKLCTSFVPSPVLLQEKFADKASKHIDISQEAREKITCTMDEPDVGNFTLKIQSEDPRNEIQMIENHTTPLCDVQLANSNIEEQTKPLCTVANTKLSITSDKIFNSRSSRRLKRSLSESDMDKSKPSAKTKQNNEGPLFLSHKRTKMENSENELPAYHMTEEGLNTLIQNRRNSISSLYYDENGSFCILIDDDCIIEQGDCDTNTVCANNHDEENNYSIANNQMEIDSLLKDDVLINGEKYDLLTSSDSVIQERNFNDNWVDDIGCVETVVDDTINDDEIENVPDPEITLCTSDVHTRNCESPFNSDLDMAYSQACQNNLTSIYIEEEHDKNILIDMNRTPPKSFAGECSKNPTENYLLDSIFADDAHKNQDDSKTALNTTSNFLDLKENICNSVEKIMTKIHDDMILMHNGSLLNVLDKDPKEKDIEISDINNTERYLRSSSSSPEVSSTTSEDRKSRIRLKITNFNGSITSQLNNDVFENKSIRYKLTEETDYRSEKPRPLITKAAQKYIPPLKETMKDLKVKLVLPRNTLIKFKEMKRSKESPKNDLAKPNVKKPVITKVAKISKKEKPNFEDVLKNIDVVHFKMHKERTKKSKKPVPKVVIKKQENGSHYTSNSDQDDYNPDLTGRKWQPWVFIEKNLFVDKMVRKGKTKAIYCHKTKTYILRLPLNLPRYKHVGTNYEISRPETEQDPSSLLKYTIRLKHN